MRRQAGDAAADLARMLAGTEGARRASSRGSLRYGTWTANRDAAKRIRAWARLPLDSRRPAFLAWWLAAFAWYGTCLRAAAAGAGLSGLWHLLAVFAAPYAFWMVAGLAVCGALYPLVYWPAAHAPRSMREDPLLTLLRGHAGWRARLTRDLNHVGAGDADLLSEDDLCGLLAILEMAADPASPAFHTDVAAAALRALAVLRRVDALPRLRAMRGSLADQGGQQQMLGLFDEAVRALEDERARVRARDTLGRPSMPLPDDVLVRPVHAVEPAVDELLLRPAASTAPAPVGDTVSDGDNVERAAGADAGGRLA